MGARSHVFAVVILALAVLWLLVWIAKYPPMPPMGERMGRVLQVESKYRAVKSLSEEEWGLFHHYGITDFGRE